MTAPVENGPLRVVGLYAENVKKLRAVEITPNGDLVVIAGANEQGKTTILECIWWAISGASHIQSQPIRKGAKKARIRLDLGEIIVERKFTEAGTSITVENTEGSRFNKPQQMLDALMDQLCFDPLAFTRMSAKDQYNELRRMVDLPVDFEALDAASKVDYDKRTTINRDAVAKRAQSEAVKVPAGTPEEPVDEAALLTKMQDASQHNTERAQRAARRQETANEAKRLWDSIPAHQKKIAELRADIELQEGFIRTAEEKAGELDAKGRNAEPLPDEIDVTQVRAQLDVARQTNANVAMRKKRDADEEEAEALEANAAALTARIDAREEAKKKAIAEAKMPIEGLGFGDGVVTYEGVPFDQASGAQKIRVSMSIAIAANPRLRVLLIKDGSLLDDKSLSIVTEMAGENDFQVWLERVDTSGKIGILIEDGQVVSVDGKPT